MSLTVELDPELEESLRRRADAQGVAPEEWVRRTLESQLMIAPPLTAEEAEARRNRAIEVLRRFREEGDPEEQRETGEFLIKALDEDRLSYRKFFPEHTDHTA
jgi:hypothetical protein